MATITKVDLATRLVDAGVGDIKEAVNIIETTLDIVKDTLTRGEDVLISGFGKFHIRDKKARKGRNPKTGEEITVTPRKVVTFHASNELRARCKKSAQEQPALVK